jgi:A/G-specific adenine glycosylase
LNSKLKIHPPSPRSGAAQAKLVAALLDWFAVNARDLPWRRTRDPYAIWVSEIMLQQTQVKTVIPFWNRWMKELPTIATAAHASSDKLHKLWEGLGYYTRVRNLQKAAQAIVKQHAGTFPKKFDDVLALPGIGRYTAGAICSIAYNQPTPILDGNVIRVLTRIFGIGENPKEKTANAHLWQLAKELVICAGELQPACSSRREEAQASKSKIENRKSKKNQSLLTSAATMTGNCSAMNQSLMELGALVCTPRNPQCLICPVKKLCVAFKEGRTEELPNLGKRDAATARHYIAFAVERNGKFLVRQRPTGVVNAHLWEFPNVEVTDAPSSRPSPPVGEKVAGGRMRGNTPRSDSFGQTKAAFQKLFGVKPTAIQSLLTVKHSITRYRITLEAFTVSPKKFTAKNDGVWKTPAQMQQLAFTSAHGKILKEISK